MSGETGSSSQRPVAGPFGLDLSGWPPSSDAAGEGSFPLGSGRRVDTGGPNPFLQSSQQNRNDPGAADAESRSDEDLLLQAGQIAEHLFEQLGELNRRESALNEQLALLDQERRSIRQSVRALEDDLRIRTERLERRETELTRKIDNCEGLIRQLESHERAVEAERAGLQQRVEADCAVMREALAAEQRQFEQQKVEWTATAKLLQGQIDERLELLQARLQSTETECATRRQELEDELRSARQTAEAAREREQTEHRKQCEHERREIERARQEFAEFRQSAERQLRDERRDHEARLQTERNAVTEELEQLRRSFEQKSQIFGNRLRFHQEHLENLRLEFDRTQQGFYVEQQQARRRHVERQAMFDLRDAQLKQARELLQLREESCARESRLTALARQALHREAQQARRELQIEKENWLLERQSQEADILRQQDLLAYHSENLEARRTRLDRLRSEMEHTHHTTLEARLAVEETFARLVQAVGDEAAGEQVELARGELDAHDRQVRESLTREMDEFVEWQERLQRESKEIVQERRTAAQRLADRENRLREFEDQLQREAGAVAAERSQLDDLKALQISERLEAEHVIRDLLRQIADLTESLGEQCRT